MLNQDQVEQIRLMLASGGWRDVVAPAMARRGQDSIKLLMLHPSERPSGSPDDITLRCRIQEVEWMLNVWKNEVVTFDLNRQREALDEPDPNAPAGGPG